MKSPKVKGIGEVVTDYGAKVMKIFKKGLLQRSLFDFYGDVKANAIRVKESSSVPQTPVDNDGGVVYVKNSDGKLYYKSNEVSEVEISANGGHTDEDIEDIAGSLVATGGTKTGITITYDDANGDMDFVVDHDAATNFVAAEHYRWDNDIQSTATINHLNLSSDTPGETEVLVMNDGDAVWGHGEKIHIQVRNDEGSTISAGQPLYSKGEIGGSNRILVGVCDANDSAKMPCIGIAHSEMNTTSTKDNFAVVSGIYNTNISGFTSLAVGDNLYIQDDGSLSQTKPTGETSLIQNVAIVLRTNGSICQGMLVSAIGRTNDVPNLNSGYVFYGNGSNQAVSTQLSTLLPPDLTVNGAGTIDANNVPTLNQNTTGNAATATALTAGDKTINGDLTVSSGTSGEATLTIISDTDNNDENDNPFIVFTQDGGAINGYMGLTGDANKWPDGGTLTGATANALVLGTKGPTSSTNSQLFLTAGDAIRLTILNDGKVGIGTTTPSQALEVSGNIDLTGIVRSGISAIKILPSDFIADDVGRPAQIDDVASNKRFLKSHSTAKLYASIDIPLGFKATAVDVFGNGTSVMSVHVMSITSGSIAATIGNGNIGTTFNFSGTPVNGSSTDYLLIELAQASTEQVFGGAVTIAKI